MPKQEGRLRVWPQVRHALEQHHLAPGKLVESCSYVLGHAYRGPEGELTILLPEQAPVLTFASDCFLHQSTGRVVLDREVKARVFLRALREGYSAVVDVHDHPFGGACFSTTDDRDDLATDRFVRQTIHQQENGADLVAAALLLTRKGWAARVVEADGTRRPRFAPLRIDQPGYVLETLSALTESELPDPKADRQRDMVGADAQSRCSRLHAVVVGAGGTGSIAAEALARLGIGTITIMDADRIEASNLNRLQGAGMRDVGSLKADWLANRLNALHDGMSVRSVAEDCFGTAAQQAFAQADLVLGCVDNRESRWWLNRVCVRYGLPWFDCATVVELKPRLEQRFRVNSVLPGVSACGHCSPVEFFPRSRPDRFLDPATRLARRKAGYVADAPQVASPAVYGINLQAVGALMAWLFGWRAPALALNGTAGGTVERVDEAVVDTRPLSGCPVCGLDLGRGRAGFESQAPIQDDLRAAFHAHDTAFTPPESNN